MPYSAKLSPGGAAWNGGKSVNGGSGYNYTNGFPIGQVSVTVSVVIIWQLI
jgi:hypothetical protein